MVFPVVSVPVFVTVPDPLPEGTANVPSALRNFPAAASPAAGAGTKPLVPPEPESPTIALSSAVAWAAVKSAALAVDPVLLPLKVCAAIWASLALETALLAILAVGNSPVT